MQGADACRSIRKHELKGGTQARERRGCGGAERDENVESSR